MKSGTGICCGGSDWTKLNIGHVRWYLLTVIDWFSLLLIAFDVVPTINASHVKAVYQQGLRAQGLRLSAEPNPELRVDQGSPNTSWVTKEFFQHLEADRSFARVQRPTDNAITERFDGSIQQEEIDVVGNYPDERSAHEEIRRYIHQYNHCRPHQTLMNFTPDHAHLINNKTLLCQEREALKCCAAPEQRRRYWLHANQALQNESEGGYVDRDQKEIVECRPKMEGILKGEGVQEVPWDPKGVEPPTRDSRNTLVLSH